MVAASIDDNEEDEKSDKPRYQLINIRCTEKHGKLAVSISEIL